MADCKLIDEKSPNPALKGKTFFAHGDKCLAQAAIYVSGRHGKTSPWNVILWFHGHHVKDPDTNLFGADKATGDNKLRESVDAADQDVVLIVPFLGYKSGDVNEGYGLRKLAQDGTGVKAYLDQVLGLLGPHYDQSGVDSSKIDKLVLGCHSGSDYLMRQASGELGDDLKKKKLKECWGFDCINAGAGHAFGPWADAMPWVCFYLYVARGSLGYGHFPSHLKYAYGTPQSPKKPRMNNAFLAAATNNPNLVGVPDSQILACFDAIQAKQQNQLSDFEKLRLETDPLLDPPQKGQPKLDWASAIRKHGVKGHYEVTQDLLPGRIKGLFAAKAPAPQPCVAVSPPAPPPKPAPPKPPPPPKPPAPRGSGGRK